MTRTIGLLLLGLAAGCGRGERTRAREDAAPPPTTPPPAVALDAGAAPAVDASLREHMAEHFAAAMRIQQAIMRNELDVARDQARYLIEHPEHRDLDGWAPYVDGMTTAARQVADAPDLMTAAGLSANLGLQCRACHSARGAIVSFVWEPLPTGDTSRVTRMKRHAWGAARLWEGLIGPSEYLWDLGAQVMVDAELRALMVGRPSDDQDMRELYARVHELSTRALTVDTPEAEAALHGDLMQTCVRCHQLARDPVPAEPPP